MSMRASLLRRRALLGALASLPIAGVAAAQDSGTLAPDTPYETPFYWVDSGKAGPTVMIVAGIHGNEGAPPRAAEKLAGAALLRGRLLVVPEANRPALAARTRHSPGSLHPDLNRNFPKAGHLQPRGEMAPALWKKTIAVAPDWVLDLHEGWGFNASSPSMGSSVVLTPDPGVERIVRPMARRVLAAINATVTEKSQRFTLIEPGIEGSYARAVVEQCGTPALVFETTWTQAASLRVSQQLLMVRTVFEALAMIE